MRVGVVITARDEERSIRECVTAVLTQSMAPVEVVVVNDNSKDNTERIAREYEGVTVVNFPIDHPRWTTNYNMARVCNYGFHQLSKDLDYYTIIGGDHILSQGYIEKAIGIMKKEGISVASGRIENESLSIRGSGRIIANDVFKKQNFSYPVNYGFETYLLSRARCDGFKIKPLDITSGHVARKTGTTYGINELRNRGMAYRCLGYSFPFTLAVAVKTYRTPKRVLAFLRGYVTCDRNHFFEDDLRRFTKQYEKEKISHLLRTS